LGGLGNLEWNHVRGGRFVADPPYLEAKPSGRWTPQQEAPKGVSRYGCLFRTGAVEESDRCPRDGPRRQCVEEKAAHGLALRQLGAQRQRQGENNGSRQSSEVHRPIGFRGTGGALVRQDFS
jgi:hypothetical protein